MNGERRKKWATAAISLLCLGKICVYCHDIVNWILRLMAKTKNIDAYCNFCNAVTKMELAGETAEGIDTSKRWAKCKKCKQKTIIDLDDLKREIKPTIQNLRTDESEDYSPMKQYRVGQTIWHQKFNDHGVIIGKETSSGGKGLVVVEFQNGGKKKLIETIQH